MTESILYKLIQEDFGIDGAGRWFHSEDHSSLVFDQEKDIFYFNSRDIIGDAFIYLTKVRGLNYTDAKEYLKANNFTGTFIHEIKDGEESVVYPKLIEIFHQNLLREEISKEYFYKRTITDETINRFQLGFHNLFYTFPIFVNGVFRQFQLRRDIPSKTIRNYYRGVGPVLYNSEIMKITNKIFFTEGLTSSIVMNQNNIPCVSSNTGAEGFQEDWFPYFINQKEIYLCYDNDRAGKLGAIHTAKILGENKCRIYTFDDFEEKGYDANDYFKDNGTKEELESLVNEKAKYTFELDKGKNETQPHRRIFQNYK